MAAQILPLPEARQAKPSPIACFLRVGDAHRQIGNLFAGGRLTAQRALIDASRLRYQRELVTALYNAGSQLVLDTEAAELAALGKFKGHSRNAPWAIPEARAPLGIDYFRDNLLDIIADIARFAVLKEFDTVMSPTHLLDDNFIEEWKRLDAKACVALRAALDQEGGQHIEIDYPIIASTSNVDNIKMEELKNIFLDLPIENIWVRVSGLGPDAGPLVIKRYFESTKRLQSLGKPIIADYLGGLAGIAAVAFGAVSGLACGAGERERFNANDWSKLPQPRDKDSNFGKAVRINLPSLQGSLTRSELSVLASARGGRRLCGCGDRSCCPHGLPDMLADPRGHGLRQRATTVMALEQVPDLRRPSFFCDGTLKHAETLAKGPESLRPDQAEADMQKVSIDNLMKRMKTRRSQLDSVGKVLRRLNEQIDIELPRARPVVSRASHGPLFRQGGK